MQIKRLKMVTLLSTLLFLLTTVGVSLGQETKIAVVDMQKVLSSSKAGKAAKKELSKKFEALKRKLEAKQRKLNAFKQEMEKKAPLMSEEARAEKERQFKRMLRELQAAREDAQFEMRNAEAKKMQPILKKLEKVVNKIGKDKNYTLIIDKNMPGLYYISPRVDITKEVIRQFDK